MALEHYGVISYDIKKLLTICISTDCQKLSMLGQAEVSALMQYISSCYGAKPLDLIRGKSHNLQSNVPGYIFMETSVKMSPFDVQFSWLIKLRFY